VKTKKLNNGILWQTIQPLFKNKYFITAFGFLIWIALFDQNNLIERYTLNRKIDQLEEEKEELAKKIEQNNRKMKELKGSNEKLEKFAREEYLMKKDNEVVFVIVE